MAIPNHTSPQRMESKSDIMTSSKKNINRWEQIAKLQNMFGVF